jgi:hypothetical protein
VASAPPLARTTWKAWTWRMVSAILRPTGGVSTSIAWMTPSGSMMNRPRSSMPWVLVVDAVGPADVACLIGQHVERDAAVDHLHSSWSFHILWTKWLSTLTENTSTSEILSS